jgi:hypothetical protein
MLYLIQKKKKTLIFQVYEHFIALFNDNMFHMI